MATALQQQLAAIAERSTHQLDLKYQRTQHSQSLLFDPKDAADQTFDRLYEICLDGFEQLCSLDKRFLPFTRSLFSEQSRVEERSQMTTAENKELDHVIVSFLRLVSGRILLKPAQKALEWLVRRFRVQDHNTEELVLAFLPYHANADIFPTMLSLLPKAKQLPPSLKFLQPYITSLAPPPRHAILYSTISNPSLFASLNTFVLGACRQGNQSATLLGFWASLMAQTISGQLDGAQVGRPEIRKQKEEEILLRILPQLQDALQIRDVPELYLGSCMVIIILVTKLELDDAVLDGLMDAVSGSWNTQTLNDGLACLAVIAQERSTWILPRPVSKKLFLVPQLAQRLDQLGSACVVDKLYAGIALSYIDRARPTSMEERPPIVETFLLSKLVSDAAKHKVLLHTVTKLLRGADAPSDAESKPTLALLFSQLATLPTSQPLLLKLLERPDVDINVLEQLCGTSLALLGNRDTDVEVDAMLIDDDPQSTTAVFELSHLHALKEEIAQTASFLTDESTGIFTTVRRLFTQAVTARADLKAFVEQLRGDEKSKEKELRLLSFLMRYWSESNPKTACQVALDLAKGFLQNLESDPQSPLVYSFIALSHEDRSVRKAAAQLIVEIEAVYKRAEKTKKLSSLAPLGKEQLYSNQHHVKWMKASDYYSVITEALEEGLEECVVDPTNVVRLLNSCIDGDDDDVELKTSVRSALFANIASHAVALQSLRIKMSLFSLLQADGKCTSAGRKHSLVPAIRLWCLLPDGQRRNRCAADGVDLSIVDVTHVDLLSAETEDEIDLIRFLMKSTTEVSEGVRQLAATKFQRLWPTISVRLQTQIAQELLSSSLAGDESGGAGEALDTLRRIKLSGDTLVALLQDVHNLAAMPDAPPSAKRRRTSNSKARAQEIDPNDISKMVRHLAVVLELVESSKPERHPELLKLLFQVFGDLQLVKSTFGSDLVYLQQIILSSILALVDSMKSAPASKIDRSALRVDLIVDCMRSTSSSQIHNAALLLIASLATWASDLVLHNVMPIFTFMSNNILRQGDDYSAHIIDRTVSQVIPPLVLSLRKKNQDLVTGAAELLLSFIAAFEHMPMHRRLQLFKKLIEALGPEEALSAVIAMLFERYPTDHRIPGFCADLAGNFSTSTQLKAIVQYIDLVADVLQPRRTVSQAIFTLDQNSPDEIRAVARTLVDCLIQLLQESQFVDSTRTSLLEKGKDGAVAGKTCTTLIDRSIGFFKSVANDELLKTSSELACVAVLNLLPTAQFVSSISPLLDNPDEALGTNILDTLEQRADKGKASNDAISAMLQVLPRVSDVIEATPSNSIKYSAVAAIDRIVEKFGRKDLSAAIAAAQVIASDACLGSTDSDLQIVSLFSLASMVDTMRDDMVGILPNIIDRTLDCLKASREGSGNQRLFAACFAMVIALADHLPWTVSSKLLSESIEACMEAAHHAGLSSSTRQSRRDFMSLVAQKIDPKLLFEAFDGFVNGNTALTIKGCSELLAIIDEVISASTKSNVSKHRHLVLSTLRRLFSIRERISVADVENDNVTDELDRLDAQRNGVVMKTVMKLNDTTFRPFFVELIEWATTPTDSAPGSDSEQAAPRLISLYSFLTTFFTTLKSLVTSYTSYILQPSAELLSTLSASSHSHRPLLSAVLSTLTATFKHDQDDFWPAPSHFSALLPPLTSLLRRAKSPLAEDEVVPALAEFAAAAAASSPDHLKALNGELLKMMRERGGSGGGARVRLAAIKAERALTARLGEDWLALLPEMLPFIGELQEDEDEGVEREALGWIKEIEVVLGESLDGMLQ